MSNVLKEMKILTLVEIKHFEVPGEYWKYDQANEELQSLFKKIPWRCLNLLTSSATEYGMLRKENYFVLTNGMSNSFYTFRGRSDHQLFSKNF